MPNPDPVQFNRIQIPTRIQTGISNPIDLLDYQFANGDVSETEYLRKKQIMQAIEVKRVIEMK